MKNDEEIINLIKNNAQKINELNQIVINYQNSNNKIIESYNFLFNNIFIDYDLKPKGVLKYAQGLCQELLDFFDKICKKYELEYWLDGGNLLGAVRHKGFVPWDDDVDVCMMRKDYEQFLEVIEYEINKNNLEDMIFVSNYRKHSNTFVSTFTQLIIKYRHGIYAGLDVFPCDYIKHPKSDIKNQFGLAKSNFHIKLINGIDKKRAIDELYDELNLTYEKQDHIIPCIEGEWGNSIEFKLFRTDKIFPLQELEFNGKFYPCPHDYDYYLSNVYGESYFVIPKRIHYHHRLLPLKKGKYSKMHMKNFLEKIKLANSNFE